MSKILIVDDAENILQMMVNYLTRVGYEVITAPDGHAALSSAEKELPDLILLDIAMPGMDGLEVLHHLKTNKKTAVIPVIMLTGVSPSEAQEAAFFEYAEGYITKPADLDHLRSRIESILSLRAVQHAAENKDGWFASNRRYLFAWASFACFGLLCRLIGYPMLCGMFVLIPPENTCSNAVVNVALWCASFYVFRFIIRAVIEKPAVPRMET